MGDVHDAWSAADAAALAAVGADMALFVGDFGNENVQVVQQVAAIDMPKAVILGNHDAWYSMSAARRQKAAVKRTLPLPTSGGGGAGAAGGEQDMSLATPQLRQQLAALSDCNVGYGAMQVPGKAASIVGARPFSKVCALFSGELGRVRGATLGSESIKGQGRLGMEGDPHSPILIRWRTQPPFMATRGPHACLRRAHNKLTLLPLPHLPRPCVPCCRAATALQVLRASCRRCAA